MSKLRQRKFARTRLALAGALSKALVQQTLSEVSVKALCREAEVSEATFFNYFPRKEDILVEIFKRELPFLKEKCQDILASDVSITKKIHNIFATAARIAVKNESISRSMLIKNFSSFSNKKYNGVFFEGFRSALSRILEKGQEEGDIRKDVPAIKLARMLEGVFTLYVMDCLIVRTRKISTKELFSRLNLCLEGMMDS